MRAVLIALSAGIAATAALMQVASAQVASAPGEPVGRQHVTASLVSETRNVVAGQPLHLALRQNIEPGWHTYWVNPGEAGLPTTIDWALPRDFRAGAIQWPTPARFTFGPVVAYGYDSDVLLPVTLTVPPGLRPGSMVTLAGHASWLACAADICIPEEAELSLSLPVGAAAEPDPGLTAAFAATWARIPAPNPFATAVAVSGDQITVKIATGDATRLTDVRFFPADADVIEDGATQSVVADNDGLTVILRRDTTKPAPAVLNGVLAFRDLAAPGDGAAGAVAISVPMAGGTPVGMQTPSPVAGVGLLAALLLGLAGGVILNLMPCVLPVLSIKLLSLLQHAQASPRKVRLHGLAYTAGIMISFAAVGATLIGLRAAGAEIGWGFQLQSPLFVAGMIYLLFAVGLSLSGVFSVGGRLAGVGGNLAMHRGYAGSFFTGALAAIVASPCTAPFMAAAIGYAITQPWYVSLAVLEAIGLGLALPYLVVAFSPRARRLLPKPGAWMVKLKEILAFPVYATAVWLIYVLSEQTGATGTAAVLAGLVMIAFAAWLYNAISLTEGRWHTVGAGASSLAAASALALLFLIDQGPRDRPPDMVVDAVGAERGGMRDTIAWQPFSPAGFEALRAAGKPVFIDFTAAWCITCKVNERIALADPAVIAAFADGGVAALRADWTRQDGAITRMIEANGRAGVPLYLFYPKPGPAGTPIPPTVLPQILTAAAILHEIKAE